MGEWMDNWLRYIAGQGYGWYLALKIGKAACLPLWVVGWLVYALLGGAFVFLGGCFVAAKETAGVIVRDFDLIAIPWVENPSDPRAVVDAITSGFAAKEVGGPPSDKPHGRRAWSLSIGFGTCAIDLSFMPITPPATEGAAHD